MSDEVDRQWALLLSHSDEWVRRLAERAFQEPLLRSLFPYASLRNLRFSHVTEYPYDPMPYIETVEEPVGPVYFRLRAANNRPLAAGTLDAMVSALVRHLEEPDSPDVDDPRSPRRT